jgi:hypothetical protein
MTRHQVFLRYDVDRKAPDRAMRLAAAGLSAALDLLLVHDRPAGLHRPGVGGLPAGETGAADLRQDAVANSCDLRFAPAQAARDRVISAVKADAPARFDVDDALNVKPQLLASASRFPSRSCRTQVSPARKPPC